ncbi:uncharacterized protein BX663DRAFT_29730 [Cokeromyces recurvatus]|uniref:uncharacterized protein n=1 Tax=Cokeromyces recurvatus TaxID=90255 RepID=UPI00221E7153|nr:uncharacterized protein BX663DRAFT_29730 [Cokeromyces recurvatus]KAI7903435.1 hypothetical protein BX663DRAFT_29730 [Cokeromyces recurvatus]
MVYKASLLLLVITFITSNLAYRIPNYDSIHLNLSNQKVKRAADHVKNVTVETKHIDSIGCNSTDGAGAPFYYVCSADNNPSYMLTHFSAVIFGDFEAQNEHGSSGPLAVQGNFKANKFTVNADGKNIDCSDTDNVDSYGFVLGGSVEATEVSVQGNAQVPSGTSGVQETISSCRIIEDTDDPYYFKLAKMNAISASRMFAVKSPNIRLKANGELSFNGVGLNNFNVLTFSTCNNGNCDIFPGKMSDPSAILEGNGNWNGPRGMTWTSSVFQDSTIILNVPVDVGSTFTIRGNNINEKMNLYLET